MSRATNSSTSSHDDLRPPAGHKRGKRIVHLLQEHRDQLRSHTQSTSTCSPPPAPGAAQQGIPPRPSPRCGSQTGRPAENRVDGISRSSQGNQPSPTAHNLLEVESLTRDRLDECIAVFFATDRPAHKLSQSRDVLVKRIHVLLYNLAGLDAPAHMVDEVPASELLTVTVAAIGAPFSSSPHLAPALRDRCCALVREPSSLVAEPLDALEATLLLQSASPLSKSVTGKGGLDGPSVSPLRLNAFGSGFAIELAKIHGLHIAPPTRSNHDYGRRQTLFWMLWESDVFRTVSAGLPCHLGEADIGWPRPLRSGFDLYRWELASIGRMISATLLSPRAKNQPQLDFALLSAVDALDAIRLPLLDDTGQLASPTAGEWAFIHSTHNLFYLVCWRAMRHRVNVTTNDTAYRLDAAVQSAAERMAGLAATIVQDHQLQCTVPVRDHMVAFVLYLLQSFSHTSWRNDDGGTQRMRCAGSLLELVRCAAVHGDSAKLADALWQAIQRASGNPPANLPGSAGFRRSLHTTPSAPPAPSISSIPPIFATRNSTRPGHPTQIHELGPTFSSQLLSEPDTQASSQSLDSMQPPLVAGVPLTSNSGGQGSANFTTAGGSLGSPAGSFSGLANPSRHSGVCALSTKEFAVDETGYSAFDEELLTFVAACGVEVPLTCGD